MILFFHFSIYQRVWVLPIASGQRPLTAPVLLVLPIASEQCPDSADAERVYPAEFGGYGKKAGLPAEDLGGLKDVSFVSQCPPDLSPSARILAICGITDHKNDADPENDGWFFSDFYLFHHLFKGVGAHQICLTSEHPEDLID